MSIHISSMTIVILKDAIEKAYSGGTEAFRKNHPDAAEDSHLFGLSRMSGNDLQEIIDEIGMEASAYAIGDMFCGAMDENPSIEFVSEDQGLTFPVWKACKVNDISISEVKRQLHWVIEEWLGNDIPEEGDEDYEKWQSMEAELDAVQTMSDAVEYLNDNGRDVQAFLENIGLDSDGCLQAQQKFKIDINNPAKKSLAVSPTQAWRKKGQKG